MNYKITRPDELYHYGVKGMKWGHHKQRSVSGTLMRRNVSNYSKAADRASSLQDRADAKWRDTRSAYRSLGNNSISRIKAVRQAQKGKGSAAAKKYLKQWDDWEKSQNEADEAEKKRRETWNKTGKNYVNRVYNNIKYRG